MQYVFVGLRYNHNSVLSISPRNPAREVIKQVSPGAKTIRSAYKFPEKIVGGLKIELT